MMKEHLIRVNSVASSSVEEPSDIIELRSRGRNQGFGGSSNGNTPRYDNNSSPTWLQNRVLIDKQVQPGDTLNKIALQYSVQISDLKRANNLLNDQEIFALPSIKIPVSRFFADRHEAENAHQIEQYRHQHHASKATPASNDDRLPLLMDTDEDEDSDEQIRKAKVDSLLQKTDANLAQVRGNLPSPGLEGGAFHFVDATSPDNTMRNIWLLIFAVVFIFVLMPLFLTLLEEKSEADSYERKHHHQLHEQHIQPSSV